METWPGWASEPVGLVDPDPRWTARGRIEGALLEALLAPWLIACVEHVGSTAIPGLPAKPIIDLQAPVKDLSVTESMASVLASRSWHFVDPALDQRRWRRFFVKVTDGRRSAHLHVMTPDTPRWDQQIAFRDALLSSPSLTAEYAALKRALAVQHSDDREAYTAGKTDFIEAVITGSA